MSRQIYKGRVVDLRVEEVALPNGVQMELEVVRHPGAAAVVALDKDGKVTLVHQYRHAAGGYIWEVPAGKLEDELPLVCAARELREEAGLAAGIFIHLGSILTTPGFTDERIHLFLARELTPAPQRLDEDEVLSVNHMPLSEALEMIRQGEIQDAKTIAALHLAAEFVRREAESMMGETASAQPRHVKRKT